MLRYITSSKINNKPKTSQNMIFQLLWKKWKIELAELCTDHRRVLCSVDRFHILDHASASFQLMLKEAIHIQREQHLNQQLHHVNLTLSF